jgi:transposase
VVPHELVTSKKRTMGRKILIYCGIDWAERTHDVALVDDTGQLLAKRHITDDAAGYKILLDLLAEYGDTEEDPIPVAIETSRGLLVALLRTGKRQVFAINPMAAARYRDRHSVSRKKSDPGDALVLANILRTDMHAHRPLPQDSDLARAVAVLARAQQDATWNRQQISNQLRSLLREYYPAALAAFEPWQNGLCRREAHDLLKAAPTPTRAARLTRTQLQAAMKRAGRQRRIEPEVERLRDVFRANWAHQPPLVEDALGKQMLALLGQLEAASRAAEDLAQAVEEAFPQHPDAEIILSFPGLGVQLGARVLAEIGDDRQRFADARGLKAYAGASPITRASGKKSSITRRWVKNDRLNHAGYLWAFASLRPSPGADAHYRRRREHGDWHAAAQRNLFNRLLGQLYHCLQKRELFDERRPSPLNSPPSLETAYRSSRG